MSVRSRTRRVTSITAAALLALAVSGCTAAPGGAASQASPTPAATAEPEPSPLAFPDVARGEIARAEFRTAGSAGAPESSSTAGDLASAAIAIDGECRGTSMDYRLTTAPADTESRVLTAGRMLCDAPVRNLVEIVDYTGPVQLTLTDTAEITEGWVVVLPQS